MTIMMPIDHRTLFLSVFLVAALAGCRQDKPALRVENQAGDAIKKTDASLPAAEGSEVIKQINPDTKVVTGEPAAKPDDPEADAATSEDKTGAVAVKMNY